MNGKTLERQKFLKEVSALPNEVLIELSNFLDEFRNKAVQQQKIESSSSFLQSIAGLGSSQEHDISERDEEILQHEIDTTYSWTTQPIPSP